MAYVQDTYALIADATDTCLMTIPVSMVNPPFAVGQTVELYHSSTGASNGWWRVSGIRRRVPFRKDPTEPGIRVPVAGAEIEVILVKTAQEDFRSPARRSATPSGKTLRSLASVCRSLAQRSRPTWCK